MKHGSSVWPDLLFERPFMFPRLVPPHFEISTKNRAACFCIHNVNVYDVVRGGTPERGDARESNNHNTEAAQPSHANSLTVGLSRP